MELRVDKLHHITLICVSSHNLFKVLLKCISGDVILILFWLSFVWLALLNLLERFLRHITLHALRVLAKSLD